MKHIDKILEPFDERFSGYYNFIKWVMGGESTILLSSREKAILEFRYGLKDNQPKSLEKTGQEFDVSRERIRQIEAKALEKIDAQTKVKDFVRQELTNLRSNTIAEALAVIDYMPALVTEGKNVDSYPVAQVRINKHDLIAAIKKMDL